MKLFGNFAVVLSAVISAGVLCAVGQSKTALREQRVFSAEDEAMKRPVPIPPEAWRTIKQDSRVVDELQNREPPLKSPPSLWFTASEVHLEGSNERDLIVMAEGELRGANICQFWVFAGPRSKLKLVLSVGTHTLEFKRTRAHGYRDIVTSGMTCCTITTDVYRFNGQQYGLIHESTEDIK